MEFSVAPHFGYSTTESRQIELSNSDIITAVLTMIYVMCMSFLYQLL